MLLSYLFQKSFEMISSFLFVFALLLYFCYKTFSFKTCYSNNEKTLSRKATLIYLLIIIANYAI